MSALVAGCAGRPSSAAPATATVTAETSRAPMFRPATPALPETSTSTRVGRSVRGREIVARRFGRGGRRLLVVGGIHGDEFGTSVAEALVDRLEEDPSLVPSGTEIHVIPCLNPDGRASGKRGNANHVDLNLNMPAANWRHDLHPNTRAAQSGLNGGASPGSEPETRAFIDYLGTGFDLIVSLHSEGGIVDWDGPGAEAIARRMSRLTGLPAKHLPVQPYATGTMGQYVPEAFGLPVITIELASPRLGDRMFEAILTSTRE